MAKKIKNSASEIMAFYEMQSNEVEFEFKSNSTGIWSKKYKEAVFCFFVEYRAIKSVN